MLRTIDTSPGIWGVLSSPSIIGDFPLLEALGGSFTPFSVCSSLGAKSYLICLVTLERLSMRNSALSSSFFLNLPVWRWVCLAHLLPHAWQSWGVQGHPPLQPGLKTRSHFVSMEGHGGGSRCSYLVLCVCSAEPTFFEWDLPSFRLGERH